MMGDERAGGGAPGGGLQHRSLHLDETMPIEILADARDYPGAGAEGVFGPPD